MAIFKLVATHPRYKMDATQPKLDLITKYIAVTRGQKCERRMQASSTLTMTLRKYRSDLDSLYSLHNKHDKLPDSRKAKISCLTKM